MSVRIARSVSPSHSEFLRREDQDLTISTPHEELRAIAQSIAHDTVVLQDKEGMHNIVCQLRALNAYIVLLFYSSAPAEREVLAHAIDVVRARYSELRQTYPSSPLRNVEQRQESLLHGLPERIGECRSNRARMRTLVRELDWESARLASELSAGLSEQALVNRLERANHAVGVRVEKLTRLSERQNSVTASILVAIRKFLRI